METNLKKYLIHNKASRLQDIIPCKIEYKVRI